MFKVILSYTESLRLACGTRDPVLKTNGLERWHLWPGFVSQFLHGNYSSRGSSVLFWCLREPSTCVTHIHTCKHSLNSTHKIITNSKKEQRGRVTPALKLISEGNLDATKYGVFN